MHSFRAYISLHSNLSDDDWEKIETCISHKIIQANRVILNPGKICKNLYFLENGSIRFFAIKFKEQITTHIIQPPSLFTSPQSFTNQIPSTFGIQALEESYLWIISRENAYRLLEIPSWNEFISNL